MKSTLSTLLALIVTTTICFGQIKAITEAGKGVILNEDGTWEYYAVIVKPFSLECSDLIITKTDKVTGNVSTGSSETLIVSQDGSETGFGIYLFKSRKTLVWSMTAFGAGSCIDDDDKMNVLFTDGTRVTMFNDTKFNCDANFTLYFGSSFGKKKELEMFKTKKVETMRVWTSDGYVEQDFDQDQAMQLMKTLDCLSK